jgi:hypothetical protein
LDFSGNARIDVYTHEGFLVLFSAYEYVLNIYKMISADHGVSVERVVGQDPASEANFSMLTQWIKECITGHPECCTSSPLLTTQYFERPLPRGSSMSAAPKPRNLFFLSEPGGQSGSYVALSHCWGPPGVTLDDDAKDTLRTERNS